MVFVYIVSIDMATNQKGYNNLNRHIITDSERGHRKPLSIDEPTVVYTIKMPLSLKERCIRKGAEWVRKMLERTCKTCSRWVKKTNRCVMDGTYIRENNGCKKWRENEIAIQEKIERDKK